MEASDDPTPHLPSVERRRRGDRKQPYDPNVDATRQEMRSFACAQCHVEYYCGLKSTMFSRSCQTFHPYPEEELPARVTAIQDRTHALMGRSAPVINAPE